ncbi:hypothetical protein HanIR_Chr07g0321311 [Helianthus annuus]|nr:hypothetical protein HanIR_Chr07g0321311 [Helianthus annuus]
MSLVGLSLGWSCVAELGIYKEGLFLCAADIRHLHLSLSYTSLLPFQMCLICFS